MQKIELDRAASIDGIGRAKFTRHLFDLINNVDATKGVVVGLEGTWGSGKSSVLEGIKPLAEELPEADRPLVLEFNPWMVSGTNGLVEAMLMQLAKDLKVKASTGGISVNSKTAERIFEYVEVLSVAKYAAPIADILAPGVGIVVGGIGYAAESASKETGAIRKMLARFNKKHKRNVERLPSLIDSKSAVENALSIGRQKIIMILDDIDRLPPADVASVIQAVKAVANFPNVIYVLAYDPVVTANAIQVAVQVNDGTAFLEKIIQLPIRLPDIPLVRFYAHARSRLLPIVNKVSEEETADVEKMWPILFAVLRTPRDIERLRTKLQIGLPMLQGEVNTADVILLEALSIVHPTLIDWISSNSSHLMDLGMAQLDSDMVTKGLAAFDMDDLETDTESRAKRMREIAGEWTGRVPDRTQHYVVRAALGFLFERCLSEWQQVERSDTHRIQRYRFWYKWRCYHDQQEPWSVQQVAGFVAEPKRIVAEGFLSDLQIFCDLMQQICDLQDVGLPRADGREMVKVFAQACDAFGVDAVLDFGHGFGPMSALDVCIDRDSVHRLASLSNAVELLSLWITRYLLTRARDRHKGGSQPVGESGLDVIIATWMDKVETQLLKATWISPGSEYSPYGLLVGLDKLQATDRAVNLARNFLKGQPERLSILLSNFEDSFVNSAFPLDVQWQVLPSANELLSLADSSSSFQEKFSTIYGVIKNRAAASA